MRVLLLSAIPPPEGGIAIWTQKYLKYCEDNRIDVNLVNTALQGGRRAKVNTKRRLTDEISRTLAIIRCMKKQLNMDCPDIVHINSSCSKFGIFRDYWCVKIANRHALPIIFHCHCNIEDQLSPSYGKTILSKISRKVSVIVALNSASLEYIRKVNNKSNAVIIPNFIEDSAVSDDHLIRPEIKECVFVGHVQRTKGCFEIIEAAKILSAIHFSLVGPADSEILETSVPDNVSLIGPVPSDRVKEYLDKADVFVFPSYTEGFSLALTEAMANGLPCVATDVGSNKDMLENHGGVIIPMNNSEAIVDAIRSLEDATIRKEASEWNIQKVREKYLINCVMSRIIDLSKGILN